MSRLLILFLIALLPLRAWSVERMVVQMQGVAPIAQVSMSAECALHMQMTAPVHATQAGADQAPEHKGCQSCQLCMPLAAPDAGLVLPTAAAPQALPRSGSAAFVSAERARDAKPPIS